MLDALFPETARRIAGAAPNGTDAARFAEAAPAPRAGAGERAPAPNRARMSAPSGSAASPDPGLRHVVLLTAALGVAYLAVAMSLAVVPIYVVDGLGLDNARGGLAVGAAFLATILTRGPAGAYADRRGGRRCMRAGLLLYAAASAACALPALIAAPAAVKLAALLAGRCALGVAESLTMVGMLGWSVGLAGRDRAGRVMALAGMGMYGAYALGGPLGLSLLHGFGFAATMATCAAAPLIGASALGAVPDAAPPPPGRREPSLRILGGLWRAGAAVALQGTGFALIGAFFSLDLGHRGWPGAGLGLTLFGAGFVGVRLVGSHLPDRLGGARVAALSLAVEAAGQYAIWLAPTPGVALAGACLTGAGCSLVFPSLGADVVRRTPAHLRATAIGLFAMFQDVAYGAAGPLAGLAADAAGYGAVFLVGGVAATLGVVAALAARA